MFVLGDDRVRGTLSSWCWCRWCWWDL